MIRLKKYGKQIFFALAVLFSGLNCGSLVAAVQEFDDTVQSLALIQPESENQTAWKLTDENTNAVLFNAFVRVTPNSNTPGFRKFTAKNGLAHNKAEYLKTEFNSSDTTGNIILTSQSFGKVKEYYVYFLRKLII